MTVYQSINLLEQKEGRPYTFNLPQANQDFSEVYEMLDLFKKQIEDIEKRQKDSQEEKEDAANEAAPASPEVSSDK